MLVIGPPTRMDLRLCQSTGDCLTAWTPALANGIPEMLPESPTAETIGSAVHCNFELVRRKPCSSTGSPSRDYTGGATAAVDQMIQSADKDSVPLLIMP